MLKVSYPLRKLADQELGYTIDAQRNYWLGRDLDQCVKVKAIDFMTIEQTKRICVLMEKLSDWECDPEKFTMNFSSIRKRVNDLRKDSIQYVDLKPRNVLFRRGSQEFKLVDLPISSSFGLDLIFSINQDTRDNYVKAYSGFLGLGQTTTQTLVPNDLLITSIPIPASCRYAHTVNDCKKLTTSQGQDVIEG